MKKNRLYLGAGYILAGLACLVLSLWFEEGNAALSGVGGGLLGAGAVIAGRFFYWSRPSRAEEYRQKLEEERISLKDERKNMLRDKSGRIAYLIQLMLCVLVLILLTLLNALHILAVSPWVILGLVLWVIFQYFCGAAVFRWLEKRM